MGIDGIKRAIGNAVNGVKQAATHELKNSARELQLTKRGLEVESQLANLKGWGPETATQRKQLTAERTQIQTELKAIAADRREHDVALNAIRNIR